VSKPHLIRGAFYLLLLLGISVIPVTLGQRNGTNSTIVAAKMSLAVALSATNGVAEAQSSISPAPGATALELWDQYNNAGAAVTLSATFTDSPAMNSDLAEDFVVPVRQAWEMRWIDIDGAYFNGPGPANSFNVFFYYDNDGFPGMQVWSRTLLGDWLQNGSTFTINLPEFGRPILYPGTYWVEIQANMTATCCGEWGWTKRTVTSVNPAVWQNPSGFFGACQSWSRRGATCGLDPSAPDQVYRLTGNLLFFPTPTPTATGTPTPTPTCVPGGTPGPWTQANVYPLSVSGAAVASNGTSIYAFGGNSNGGGEHAEAYRYDPSANTWTALASMPTGPDYLCHAEYGGNGKIYVMGGGNGGTLNRIYDIATNSWSAGAPVPEAVFDHGHAYWNGKIYVIGGIVFGVAWSAVYAYDVATNTWSEPLSPLPQAEFDMACGAINNKIYCANGSTSTQPAHPRNELFIYDIAANSWTTGANSPQASIYPAGTVVGGKLYIDRRIRYRNIQ
jgi:hypothetical protein